MSENTGAAQTSSPEVVSDLQEDEDLEAQLAYENFKRRRESRKRRRILVGAIVVVVALVAGIAFFSGRADQVADQDDYDPYEITGTVYRGDFSTTVSANGATEPLASTVVTPEVDGIIEGLQIAEGSHVEAGDVLFTLKNESLDKTVREANSQLESAQRAANNANRAVDQAYATYQREWKACNESGDWSSFDEAALLDSIETAEAGYSDALAGVESARDTLTEAQDRANKRTVVAPVSGSVVAMNAVNGASVGSASGGDGGSVSGPLVQISDLSQMKVTVQVNEVDIASISEGQSARATFSALPGVELDATVQRIASVATGSGDGYGGYGGVVTYAVDLLIPDPDPDLKPGMTATVTITTQYAPDVLIVPSSAVWDDYDANDQPVRYVTVVVDPEQGEARDVAVRVIEENNSEAAVESLVAGDLMDGDQVMLGGGGMGGSMYMDETDEFGNMAVENATVEGMYEEDAKSADYKGD